MKVENFDDLSHCFNLFLALKDKFKKAKLLDEFEQALELHHALAEVAHNASKAKKRSSNESNDTDSKPKRDYDSSKRAQIEHTKRLEKLATLEQKEQEGTLTQQDKRKLKNIREAERGYMENKDKSSG
ncbi:hypothetical protein NHP200010_04160 [Helicobacter bizzozeronii]|uniref:hypothetical protein n=1 Tax=Helicobacter bizzozeronii TaxID=56877 RepID=UPI00244D94FC|nr:hypothetical protein [Helicobacter bizzozeronii]GMB92705.1 hypothetical protein NHP200010_04160 [Helicobacter bizzozeronii]